MLGTESLQAATLSNIFTVRASFETLWSKSLSGVVSRRRLESSTHSAATRIGLRTWPAVLSLTSTGRRAKITRPRLRNSYRSQRNVDVLRYSRRFHRNLAIVGKDVAPFHARCDWKRCF